jgi:hypothetical protein
MVKATIPAEVSNPIVYLHSNAGGLGRPFFESLVPYSVRLAISIYDNRKDEFARELESSANDLLQVAARCVWPSFPRGMLTLMQHTAIAQSARLH